MITIVMQMQWSSISKAYDEFYVLKTTQGYWLLLCIFYRILEALITHTI